MSKMSPRPLRNMNVGNILRALEGSGLDGVRSAEFFARVTSNLQGRILVDMTKVASEVVDLLDQNEDVRAFGKYQQARREVNSFITALKRSVNDIEAGIRWHTGLHKQAPSDPLFTSIGS